MSELIEGFDGLQQPAQTGVFMRIRHSVRKDGQIPGTFEFTDGSDPTKSVRIIIVGTYGSRACWLGGSRSGPPTCQSRDMVRGNRYGLCAECEYSLWDGDKPPACNSSLNVICINPVQVDGEIELQPLVWNVTGKAIQEVSEFIREMIDNELKPWEYVITVALEIQTGGLQVRYRPVFPPVDQLKRLNETLRETINEQRPQLLRNRSGEASADDDVNGYTPPAEAPSEPLDITEEPVEVVSNSSPFDSLLEED